MEQLDQLLGNQFADNFHDYGDYSTSIWRYHHRQRLAVIDRYITKYSNNGAAMDAGAGKGPVTYLLSKTFKEVHSFEYSNDELKRLEENLSVVEMQKCKVNIKQVDLTNIPLKDKSVNFIVCSEVLEHIPDEKKAVRELYRVLNDGSYMIVSMPNKNSIFWFKARVFDYIRRFILKRNLEGGYSYWELSRHWGFSARDIQSILSKEGFEIVETKGIGFLSFSPKVFKKFYKNDSLKYLLSADILFSRLFKVFSPYYFVTVKK